MLRRLALVTFLLLPAALAAEKWTRYESEHFELLTDGGKGRAMEVLEQFERVRWFFGTTMKIGDPPIKPRIVVFGNDKLFRTFAPRESTAAFYAGMPFRDYIAIGPVGESQARRTAVHEYIHLLVKHSEMKLPLWMNEGLAELYSTIDEYGGKIRVGNPISYHLYQLNNEWLPLRRIVSADHDSAEYNKKEHVGLFYSTSWALMHMLQLEDDMRPKFNRFNQMVLTGMPVSEAMEKAYGMTLEQVEGHLKGYVRGNSVRVAIFDLKFDKSKLKLEGTPASPRDYQMALADLSMARRDCPAAIAKANAVEAEFPEAPEPHVTKGYCAWGYGDQDRPKAGAEFAAAARKGSPVAEVYQAALGLMPPEARRQEAPAILEAALRISPDSHELRMSLANEFLMQKEYDKAYLELKKLKSIKPAEVDQYFPVYIQAAWWSKRYPEAQNAAEQYVRVAKTPEAIERAGRLQRLAEMREPKQVTERPSAYLPPPPGVNLPPRQEPEIGGSTVRGKFVEFVCGETDLRLLLEVDGNREAYWLANPEKVTAVTKSGNPVDLSCGKQKGEEMELLYEPGAGPQGTRGQIRIMRWL
jgi:tetratricopeptide (TPR) repeat protein